MSLLFFTATGTLFAQTSEQPKPGPEHKRLEIWTGVWRYEGEGFATPFGPAGKFKGKEISRMVLNGMFLENRWKDKSENGWVAEGVVFTGYDALKKTYFDRGFDNDGMATILDVTVEGNVWTAVGRRTDATGTLYQTRFTRTLSSNGRGCTIRAEYSRDDGKTWSTWWHLTSKKS